MKYKVGDKVIPRKDLLLGVDYPMADNPEETNDMTKTMLDLAERDFLTIKYVGRQYMVEEADAPWGWTDSMFVGLAT